MNQIKKIAKILVDLPIIKIGEDYINHPFFQKSQKKICIGNTTINLLDEEARAKNFYVENTLNRVKSLDDILMWVDSTNRLKIFLFFLKKGFIKDFNEIKESLWGYYTQGDSINITEFLGMEVDDFIEIARNYTDISELPSEDEVITIYRGCGDPYHPYDDSGISWTLDYEKAEFFAKRLNGDRSILSAKVRREDILFYTNSRDEKEVIVDPKMLIDVEILEDFEDNNFKNAGFIYLRCIAYPYSVDEIIEFYDKKIME